mgnify:CR=1 FL=1
MSNTPLLPLKTSFSNPHPPQEKVQIHMSDAIGLYLNEIGKVPLLNAEDERNLSKAIEKGRDATKKLEAGERGAALRADLRAAAKA